MKKLLPIILTLTLCPVLGAFAANTETSTSLDAQNPVAIIAKTSQYVRITGKVSNTDLSDHSKVIFLNFGNSYNTSLSAIIYDQSIPSFVTAGIDDPKEYFKDKNVTIEGIVRISNGKPEVIIESPNQIKVIDN